MIDHMGITVSDLYKSKEFYAKTLHVLGYEMCMDSAEAVSFGILHGPDKSADPGGDFWLKEGMPMTPRLHIAFNAVSRGEVDAFYKAGLAAGGIDNGPPNLRSHYHPHYYAAFLLDPDGYNIEAVCHTA